MLSLLKTTVLVTLLAAITNGTPIEKRHDKFIVHELERDGFNLLDKRTPSELQWFADTGARWYTKLKLGSSQEPVRVTVDTGSVRLNVPVPGATCQKRHVQLTLFSIQKIRLHSRTPPRNQIWLMVMVPLSQKFQSQ